MDFFARKFRDPTTRPKRKVLSQVATVKMQLFVTTILLLILIISCVKAGVVLIASTPAHQGSVALRGKNETCRTIVEAALRCEMAEDGCAGVWIHDNGSVLLCQLATCPLDPSKINPITVQAGFFFLMSIFTKGN